MRFGTDVRMDWVGLDFDLHILVGIWFKTVGSDHHRNQRSILELGAAVNLPSRSSIPLVESEILGLRRQQPQVESDGRPNSSV